MLTLKLLERVRLLAALLSNESFLMTSLTQLETYRDRVAKAIHAELEADSTIEDKQRHVRSEIDAGIAAAKKISPRRLMPELDAAESAARDVPGVEGCYLAEVVEQFQEFARRYDTFFDVRNKSNAFDLFSSAASLRASLIGVRSFAAAVEIGLSGVTGVATELNPERLRVILSAGGDLRLVGAKITALADIYYELSVLLEVSTTDHPPEVARVEAGSLWIEIVGNVAVITAATAIIGRAAVWIHQRFTKDGRVTVIPRNVDAIERILRVSDELAERGINVGAINEQLAKSTYLIAENLNTLLSDEARVELNDQVFSVSSAFEQRRLLSADARALPAPKPDDGTGNEEGGGA